MESSLDLAIATTLANNGPYDPNGLFQYLGQFNQATDPSGSLSGGFSGSLTGTYLGMDAAANYTGILVGDPEYTLSGDMKVPGLGDGDFTGNINDNGNGADVGVQIATKNGGTYKGSVKGATRIRDKIGHKTIYEGDMSIGGYTETFRFVVNDIKAGDDTGTVSGSIMSEINGNTIDLQLKNGLWADIGPPGGGFVGQVNFAIATSVPEPSSLVLAAIGVFTLVGHIYRRRHTHDRLRSGS